MDVVRNEVTPDENKSECDENSAGTVGRSETEQHVDFPSPRESVNKKQLDVAKLHKRWMKKPAGLTGIQRKKSFGLSSRVVGEELVRPGSNEDELASKNMDYTGPGTGVSINANFAASSSTDATTPKSNDIMIESESEITEKLEVECMRNSETWAQMIDYLTHTLTDIQSETNYDRVIEKFNILKLIVHSALDLSTMQETDAKLKEITKSKNVFIYFGGTVKDILETFVYFITNKDFPFDEQRNELVTQCFQLISSILCSCEFRNAEYEEIKGLITFLCLPWMDKIVPGNYMDSKLFERCSVSSCLHGKCYFFIFIYAFQK